MKTAKIPGLLTAAFAILALMLNSCQKDEEASLPPSVTIMEEEGFISNDVMVAAGGELNFKIKMEKGDLDITNFLINVYTDDVQTYFDTGMNTSFLVWEGSFIKSLAPDEEWSFIVRDRDGNSSSTSLNILLDTSTAYHPLKSFQNLVMGAPQNNDIEGCLDPKTGDLYFHANAATDTTLQSLVDILYMYHGEDNNTIASPGANIADGIFPVNPGSWTIVNTTRYFKTDISMFDFCEAQHDSIILANYEEGEAKRKAKDLQFQNIYTFKTQDGTLGMFMVNEVLGTNAGTINIDLKIQE